MATKIDIGSNASIRVGSNSIQSFTEDTKEAEVVSNLYESVKKDLLSDRFWNFAFKNVNLGQLAAEPDNQEWDHAYQLPSDRIMIAGAFDKNGNQIDYIVQGDTLLSNSNSVNLKYVYDIDEGEMPPWFVAYLELYLASQIAMPITENLRKLEAILLQLEQVQRNARRIDAQENPPAKIPDKGSQRYINARFQA